MTGSMDDINSDLGLSLEDHQRIERHQITPPLLLDRHRLQKQGDIRGPTSHILSMDNCLSVRDLNPSLFPLFTTFFTCSCSVRTKYSGPSRYCSQTSTTAKALTAVYSRCLQHLVQHLIQHSSIFFWISSNTTYQTGRQVNSENTRSPARVYVDDIRYTLPPFKPLFIISKTINSNLPHHPPPPCLEQAERQFIFADTIDIDCT
jgi:hypothetical protein